MVSRRFRQAEQVALSASGRFRTERSGRARLRCLRRKRWHLRTRSIRHQFRWGRSLELCFPDRHQSRRQRNLVRARGSEGENRKDRRGKMIKSLTLPDPERDHISGSADGSIRLLEYGDYECPFCGEVQPIVKEIQRRLGDDLCFAFRHFPLTNVHPHAEHAAEAAEAAAEQSSFWAMHETLFANQNSLDSEALAEYSPP